MLDIKVKQEQLEDYIHTEANLRANKDTTDANNRSEWASSKLGSKFVQAVLDQKDNEYTDSFTTTIKKRKSGPSLLAARLLTESGVSPEALALIATKVILNICFKMKRPKRSSLCMYIGQAIDTEVAMLRFASTKERKALLKKLFKDFDKRTYPKHWRVTTVKNYFDAEQVDWRQWEPKQHLSIGLALLAMFRNSTGLVDYASDGTFVELSDKLMERIEELLVKNTSMFALFRPMVAPPKPWSDTNLFKGGYYTRKLRPYPLIKGSGRRDVERLVKLDLSQVIKAVNAIQETPWRVNKRMLDAQKWAYHVYGGDIGSMAGADEEPLPPLPEDYHTNEDVKKAHNRLAFEVHDRRRRVKTKRIGVLVTHAFADEMIQYDKIYFPHNLDSRGRAYPIPAFLNPQGPDYVKSLLEFAEGKPVNTQEAENWLAIAGANAWGQDKVSLADRVKWVKDNSIMIHECAMSYQVDHRWMQASEPFQFLRFCFEWSDYMSNPATHLSHMVIPVDATNSGLQHYSAMLCDEVGGRSVNLIPGLSRQDIYGDVAHRVVEYLMEEGTEEAKDWIKFGIDRKLTKRQVMVVPYAGKFSSCLTYTREAVNEKLASGVQAPWPVEQFNERTIHLAKLIWKAIDETVVKGKIAMTYLSKIAGEYAKSANASGSPLYDRRMAWLTPDGFEVVHFREDEEMHRVKTTFEGSVFLSYYRSTGRLNAKDMALACPPNFVHALDATHLRMTVNKALDIGITDFGMVHDSFGVHAAEMSRFLQECVKPAFVQMYTEHDVIGEFAKRFEAQSLSLPKPEKGTLDLQGILRSEFFFS
jgi:DNA-directed RNA polymerase